MRKNRPRYKPAENQHHQLVKSFMDAVLNGNTDALENMLAEDAIAYSDGGGKITAAPKPIKGAHKIARFMNSIQKKVTEEIHLEFRNVNGGPGLASYLGGRLYSVWSFNFEGDKIGEIFVVLNPDKLGHLEKQYHN